MKIIALTGPHNCGKSTTLNIVFDQLKNDGGKYGNKITLGNPEQRDFSVKIEWKGLKIGFFTMGDYSTYLADGINDWATKNIDILICAVSIEKPMIKAHAAMSKFKVKKISKQKSNTEAEQIKNDALFASKIINDLEK